MSRRQPFFVEEFEVDAGAGAVGSTQYTAQQQRGYVTTIDILTSNTTLANLRDAKVNISVDGDQVYKNVSLLRFYPTDKIQDTALKITCPPGGTITVECDNTGGAGTIEIQASVVYNQQQQT